MQPLSDPRREAFAQARVAGATRSAAYVQAGYADNRGNACKLAAKPEVAARIAELRRMNDPLERATLSGTIIELVLMADKTDVTSAAGMKEARVLRLEANRLKIQLEIHQDRERFDEAQARIARMRAGDFSFR